MTAPKWITTPSFLGTYTQRIALNIPVYYTGTDVTFSAITGKLPDGLSLSDSNWLPSTLYSIGNKVIHLNKSYTCKESHRSSARFDPAFWNRTTKVTTLTSTASSSVTVLTINNPTDFYESTLLIGDGLSTSTYIKTKIGNVITLSEPTQPFSVSTTVKTTANTGTLTLFLTSLNKFYKNAELTGRGFRAGTTIKSVNTNSITLSTSTTARITATSVITATNYVIPAGSTIESVLPTSINIIGNPFAVSDVMKHKFVVRAKNSSGVADLTLSMNIEGPTAPYWITSEGFLPVGTSGENYTVNQQIVDYQLTADANVLTDNIKVRYYINDGDGTLPPGLTLSEDGRLSGYIDENLGTDTDEGIIVGFDNESYDNFPYDFIELIDGQLQKPKFVTKLYQFYVTASDGFTSNSRLFKILLLDHNMFKVDTTWIRADSDYFANVGSLFTPTWLSPANLGSRRADNYQMVEIYKYDPFPEEGPIKFTWDNVVNSDVRCLADSRFYGAGIVDGDGNILEGQQIYNIGQEKNNVGDDTIWVREATSRPQVGQYIYLPDFFTDGLKFTGFPTNPTSGDTWTANGFTYVWNGYRWLATLYQIKSVTPSTDTVDGYQLSVQYEPTKSFDPITGQISIIYNGSRLKTTIPDGLTMFIGDLSERPPGFELNETTGMMYGKIPHMPAYSKSYRFTIRVTKTDSFYGTSVYSNRVFTLNLKGDIESNIVWDTDNKVGSIANGYQSELFIKAHHIKEDIGVQYKLVSGELPPGMNLEIDGTLSGKIPYNSLTFLDGKTFYLDNDTTSIDRQYDFVALAKDNYNLSAVAKNFYIQIADYSQTQFTDIYVQPFMNRDKRVDYRNFITSETLFDKSQIYRPYDPAFGIQYQLKLLIEAGIQKLTLADYVISLQQYFYNKRFYFGDVKSIPATNRAGETIYELVYVDIFDASSPTVGLPNKSVGISINGRAVKVYPNAIENWRSALEATPIDGHVLEVDEFLRPRFMNSIQADTGAPLGFIKAVPLCYAMPGFGATIVKKIKLTGFDFKLLDFEVDRLIVEETLESNTAKYLKFPRTRLVVPTPEVDNNLAGADGVLWSFDDNNTITSE